VSPLEAELDVPDVSEVSLVIDDVLVASAEPCVASLLHAGRNTSAPANTGIEPNRM
jgi:hypothetical protein